MSTLGFEDSDVKSCLLLNCVFRVGKDQTGQCSDIEPDLRHAPLIINESGGNANTKTMSEYTSRETTGQFVVGRKKESDSEEIEDATRYRSPCMRLSYLAHDKPHFAETAKHLAQRINESREFDFAPLKRAPRHLLGKPTAALRFRRQEHVDNITVFVHSDFAGDLVSRKSTTGFLCSDG